MFTNGISVAFRSCNQMDILRFSIVTINAFQSGSNACDELQICSFIDKFLIYLKSAADYYSVVIMDFGFYFFFGGSKIGFVLETRVFELFPKKWMIGIDVEDVYGFRFQVSSFIPLRSIQFGCASGQV